MNCPKCSSCNVVKDGKTVSGYQSYRCKDCKKKFSESGLTGGRPTIFDKQMTGYERLKRHYRKKEGGE
jgi:transposase-like protein